MCRKTSNRLETVFSACKNGVNIWYLASSCFFFVATALKSLELNYGAAVRIEVTESGVKRNCSGTWISNDCVVTVSDCVSCNPKPAIGDVK